MRRDQVRTCGSAVIPGALAARTSQTESEYDDAGQPSWARGVAANVVRVVDSVADARRAFLERFVWVDGHADTWSMFRDAASLAAIVDGLADLIREDEPDVIIGIESRGFVLAPAVALRLGVGFAPVRKLGALFPGDLLSRQTTADYRGKTSTLMLRADHLDPGQRAALVDDWIETGSQARAVAELVGLRNATLAVVAVVVDEASDDARRSLPIIRSIVSGEQLP